MTGIAASSLKLLDIAPGAVRKLSDAEAAEFNARMREMLTQQYTRPVDYANYPANQAYATVEVNGKVVATVYNGGSMEASNATYAQYGSRMPNDGQGPQLAQQRAEYLAKMMGGKVVKAGTAITQTAYSQLPPMQFRTDMEALMADPLYERFFGGNPPARTATSEEVKTDGVTSRNLAALLAQQEVDA